MIRPLKVSETSAFLDQQCALCKESFVAGDEIVIDMPVSEPEARSKVRVMPSSSLGCAQTCLLLSIALAIILIAVGCFGLWAIVDYILIDRLGWEYRAPLGGIIVPQLFLLWQIRPW